MGHTDRHDDEHIDRGMKKSDKRSKRGKKMQSLREWMDVANNGEDLEDYLYEDEYDEGEDS